MKTAVLCALGLLLWTLLFFWMLRFVRYRISRRYVKITLFGLCLRRIPLNDIDCVTKRRPVGWTENWVNTVRPSHRTLVIRRRHGLRKNILITPKNRYVFKTNLEKAVRRVSPTHGTAQEPEDFTGSEGQDETEEAGHDPKPHSHAAG